MFVHSSSSSSVSSSPARTPRCRSCPGLRAHARPSVYGSVRSGRTSVYQGLRCAACAVTSCEVNAGGQGRTREGRTSPWARGAGTKPGSCVSCARRAGRRIDRSVNAASAHAARRVGTHPRSYEFTNVCGSGTGAGSHRSGNARAARRGRGRGTHLAALARDAPVHVVVVALDGGLALGDAPEVPGEHGADCEAHDGGEDPGHDEHDRGGAVAPVVLSAAAAGAGGQMEAREG